MRKKEQKSKARMCEVIFYDEDISRYIEVVKSKNSVEKYLYIKHDKDVYSTKDELNNPLNKAGTLKKAHWHLYLHFKDSRAFAEIANWFGVQTNAIQRVKTQNWVYAVAYSIHLNAPEKYQYSKEDVMSNYDWEADLQKYIEKNGGKKRLDEIIEGIDSGKIKKYNMEKYISMTEYVKWERPIKKAFEYWQKRRQNEKNHKMEVVYMSGPSGTGKTSYAVEYCKRKGISYCLTGTSNDPCQDYKGEECLIIDELRAEVFTVSDLLRMLDNDNGSSARARYDNKFLDCNKIFITSSRTIEELFEGLKGHEKESIVQLKRRCKMMMLFTQEAIEIVLYDAINEDYDWSKKRIIPNPIAKLYKKQHLTEEKLNQVVEDILFTDDEAKFAIEETNESQVKPKKSKETEKKSGEVDYYELFG